MKETRFYQRLETYSEVESLLHRHLAESPFEKVTLDYLQVKIRQLQQSIGEQQHWINLSEQSMTEFIHDIKTPVTALKLLIEKEENSERRHQLMFEWSRIDYMLDQQLFIARLNHQSNDMYFESVKLRSILIEEIQQTRHLCLQKGIGFDLSVSNTLTVYTDKRWIRMVIRQIISNAIKYSNHADISIYTTFKYEQVHLHIQDRGSGIAAHDLPRIFKRGYTGKNKRYQRVSSGMGLYLVDAVRDALGIQVTVDSEVGEGTTVSIHFPKQNENIARMSK
ncbi:sensor histidine kinase [Staphylococcus sp. MI 10-1553]|uniref:sensor histidine kinase n=1 Tax=Staphylococcus sp. MI 10-1553 TaxID=1912064 RepID=UPI001EF144AF|nr:sensor histidine kinase [Staphylococcus sp. MI 10-1553]